VKYLAIKNFEQFQHYKDRAPLWIKMHTSVLSDFALLTLPEAAQGQLFKLWILASRMENRIPNDKKFISAQIFSKKLYLDELIAAGFIIATDDSAQPLRADWSSRYVPADVKARILAKTDGRCAACDSDAHVEIDHIVPISKGGTGDESNLQALCRKCNRKKRARTATAEQLATQGYADAEPREEKSREEGEKILHLHLHPTSEEAGDEANLAAMLETDADRLALTAVVSLASNRLACIRAFASMLTGNDPATPQPTPGVFGQALRDMATNGARPTAKLFRGYLLDAARPRREVAPPFAAGASGSVGARRETWSQEKDRKEEEEGQRQLIRIRAGNVEQRRGDMDGFEWYERMKREAKSAGLNVTLYAYERMHEPADLAEVAHV
jgi:hypothetical protein